MKNPQIFLWQNLLLGAILGFMDKYFLAIIALITISILVILHIRISAKNPSVENSDKLKDGADFTILE